MSADKSASPHLARAALRAPGGPPVGTDAAPARDARPIHPGRTLKRWSRLVAKVRLGLRLPGEGVAFLDYDRRPIRLGVSTDVEYHTRLHSCQKEPEVIEWIEQDMGPGDVLYDVGANVGAYALVAASYWGGAVTVVAVEPSAVNFARLVRNIALNSAGSAIIPLPVALSEATGLRIFHYENLSAGGALHALGEAVDYRGAPFRPVASCAMLAFDLDTLIEWFQLPRPTHMKLDVDGTELAILRGARRTLRNLRSVLMEVDAAHPQAEEARDFLREQGFEERASYPYRYGDAHPEFRGIANVMFWKMGSREPRS